jgi:hypothetical protein
MKKIKTLLFNLHTVLVVTIFVAGCNESTISTDDAVQVVVEGYLYQGEKIDSIHLTKTVSFESGDSIFPPITDATLTITSNNNRYTLQNIGNGYYNYPETDLSINVGETYSISVVYNNEEITSTTIVPSIPENIALSDSSVAIDTTFTRGFPPTNMGPSNNELNNNGLQLTWDNPNNDYFFVVIESIDPNAEAIVYATPDMPNMPEGFKPPTGNFFRFRSEPFKNNEYTINSRSLENYGMHRVKLYRVNQEYADLYENRQQDSRNLTEPLTNIKNGLGIFTAFSYAEATFNVIRKTE